ncbi:MAG: TetR/AcrR family transcriptional regulator [Geminicoccaceae bacterium]
MARSRGFDTDHVLDALKHLFWEKGFEGTSYADVMQATRLQKGSLYGAFGDKRALYLRALDAYVDREVATAVDLLTGQGTANALTSDQRIRAFLEFPIAAIRDHGDRRGCFLCNAAVDLAPFDPDVEATVVAAMAALKEALQVALAERGKADEDAEQGDRESAAAHLMAVYFGMRIMAKAGVPVSGLSEVQEMALRPLGVASGVGTA